MIDVIIPTVRTPDEIGDLVAEIERTAGCPVQVLPICQNNSAAKNRNIGMDQSTSDPIVFVDDDMEGFPADWLVKLCKVLRENKNCVMVSVQLQVPGTGIHPANMMGGVQVRSRGVSRARKRELPTACAAVRRTPIRFDEHYVGSGWEDCDFCRQLIQANRDAEFLVCHDVWVVHRNEMKGQRGDNWTINSKYFRDKWYKKP